MNSPKPMDIRQAIRKEFNFLVESYGYEEKQPQQSAVEIYSEVQFQKHGWTISIQTTAHDTGISHRLISPDDQLGFLSFLYDPKTAQALRSKFTPGIYGDILYTAQCLKTIGSGLLTGDCNDFKSILAMVQDKHRSWLLKSRIVSEADLDRLSRQE